MHVARVVRKYQTKDGPRESVSHLLRRTFRDGGKVRHETLANLSALPDEAIAAVRACLAGQRLVPAAGAVRVAGSLPHGHVAAVWAMAHRLGLPAMLGPAGRQRDLALALIVARVVEPGSKLATVGWWADTTLGVDLGVAGASTDEVYAAMDWLLGRQDAIEAQLAVRHLGVATNPARLALFDLSSSWVEGRCCPLAARGYSRDGKKGKDQIEYGLLTDPAGRPVAVRVFPGNTADPTAFVEATAVVRDRFGLTDLVMVGDRGMITSARIDALREAGDLRWLTCLRAPQIAALAADDGPLQMSLFDTQDLAEISHPDFPDERLIACHNPALAAERARKREQLLAATDAALAPITARVQAGKLSGAAAIGVRVGAVVNKWKMAKHLQVAITDTTMQVTRREDAIAAEAALDGIYVLRTNTGPDQLNPADTVTAYKALSNLERDWRTIKVDDLELRPIRHWLETRVRAHVLICMLAAYLVWHLRKAWAPLTYTDQHPPTRDNPVTAATRSPDAARKASRHRDEHDQPLRSFTGLLHHLATLTRNKINFGGTDTTTQVLADPTTTHRRAFELINSPIPLTLK
jgi:hypothetical protein